MSRDQLDSKYDSPVLLLRLYVGIETISRCLLIWMARMDMDSNLKKLGQLFQVLMVCLQKSPKHSSVKCFLMKFVSYFTNLLQHFNFFVWVKVLSHDFSTESTLS